MSTATTGDAEGIARLAAALSVLHARHRADLERWKEGGKALLDDDYVWRSLLESWAAAGSSRGYTGLIENGENFEAVSVERLRRVPPAELRAYTEDVMRRASVRSPAAKAAYVVGALSHLETFGGAAGARRHLLKLEGRTEKLRFWKSFPGIGAKYARDIPMRVYDADFRETVAVDMGIQRICTASGFGGDESAELEEAVVEAAHAAGLDGWSADRLLHAYEDEAMELIDEAGDTHALPSASLAADLASSLGLTEDQQQRLVERLRAHVGKTLT